MERAYADVAAGKPGFPIGTPPLDHLLPPLFDVGRVSVVFVSVRAKGVSSLVFIEKNVGGRKLNILVI